MIEKFKGLEFGLQDLGQNLLDAVKMCAKHPVYSAFVLSFILSSCSADVDQNGRPTQFPDVVTQAQATEAIGGIGIEATSTLAPQEFLGEPVTPELVTDNEKLVQKAKEFVEGSLVLQTFLRNRFGQITGVDEKVIDQPGQGEQYKVLSVFEIHNESAVVKDEFVWIRSMSGEQFLAIKLKNAETDAAEYVRLGEDQGQFIAGLTDLFVPMVYADVNEQGAFEAFYPLAFAKGNDGFTGQAIYGEDQDTYSLMTLGNYFTAKNAMLAPQLEATMNLIDQQMKDQGISEYNYGVDVSGKGWIVYGADGKELKLDESTGEWGVESPTIALFDKYGVDPATYTLAEVDGVMVGTDNETGVEIFRDGRFEISYAVELAKKDCKPTDIEPSADGLLILYQSWDSSETYISEIMKDLNFPPDVEGWGLSILIDREKQCWVWANSSNIYYRDETGLAKAVPIIHLTEDEMVEFIINGKFKEELTSP